MSALQKAQEKATAAHAEYSRQSGLLRQRHDEQGDLALAIRRKQGNPDADAGELAALQIRYDALPPIIAAQQERVERARQQAHNADQRVKDVECDIENLKRGISLLELALDTQRGDLAKQEQEEIKRHESEMRRLAGKRREALRAVAEQRMRLGTLTGEGVPVVGVV